MNLNYTQQQSFQLFLLIQFIEIPNEALFYAAPAPRSNPYLANVIEFIIIFIIFEKKKFKGCVVPIL